MQHRVTRLIFSLSLLLITILPSLAAERIIVRDMNGARIAPLDFQLANTMSPPNLRARGHSKVSRNFGDRRRTATRKATVLVFITTDCPIANVSAPEIERIYRAYGSKQIAFYLVYVDASQTAAAVRKHHKEYGYTCPAVLDPEHQLVTRAHATVTPEAALFATDGRLLYHGRVDDRAVGFGQVRAQPTRHNLRDTLDAYLKAKPIPMSNIKAVGCVIADLDYKQ
jgi:hypothetical protein